MPDWDPEAYARFRDLRLRPALDLLARVPQLPAGDVVDLGCGAGAAGPALAVGLTLHAELDLRRTDVTRFDFSRPFGGTVVLEEENLAFLRVPRGAGFPAGLEPGCFAVDLLNRAPVRLPAPRGAVAVRGVDAAVPDPDTRREIVELLKRSEKPSR